MLWQDLPESSPSVPRVWVMKRGLGDIHTSKNVFEGRSKNHVVQSQVLPEKYINENESMYRLEIASLEEG